jgi:putative transcriptional regulator
MKNLKLKAARAGMDMSQAQLAEAVGVSRQTINAIENEKYNPTLELAMKLARYIKIPVEQLFLLD